MAHFLELLCQMLDLCVTELCFCEWSCETMWCIIIIRYLKNAGKCTRKFGTAWWRLNWLGWRSPWCWTGAEQGVLCSVTLTSSRHKCIFKVMFIRFTHQMLPFILVLKSGDGNQLYSLLNICLYCWTGNQGEKDSVWLYDWPGLKIGGSRSSEWSIQILNVWFKSLMTRMEEVRRWCLQLFVNV